MSICRVWLSLHPYLAHIQVLNTYTLVNAWLISFSSGHKKPPYPAEELATAIPERRFEIVSSSDTTCIFLWGKKYSITCNRVNYQCYAVAIILHLYTYMWQSRVIQNIILLRFSPLYHVQNCCSAELSLRMGLIFATQTYQASLHQCCAYELRPYGSSVLQHFEHDKYMKEYCSISTWDCHTYLYHFQYMSLPYFCDTFQ